MALAISEQGRGREREREEDEAHTWQPLNGQKKEKKMSCDWGLLIGVLTRFENFQI